MRGIQNIKHYLFQDSLQFDEMPSLLFEFHPLFSSQWWVFEPRNLLRVTLSLSQLSSPANAKSRKLERIPATNFSTLKSIQVLHNEMFYPLFFVIQVIASTKYELRYVVVCIICNWRIQLFRKTSKISRATICPLHNELFYPQAVWLKNTSHLSQEFELRGHWNWSVI